MTASPASAPPAPPTPPTPTLTAPIVLLMSIATGLAVASNYYAQPLLHTIGQQFGLSNGPVELRVGFDAAGAAGRSL